MKLQNISMMGEGSITGGSYQSVRIMGEGKLLGNIDADKLTVLGTLSGESDLKVGALSISGEGRFRSVVAESIKIMGNAVFAGTIKTNFMKVSGNAEVKSDIKTEILKIFGTIEGNSIESEEFISYGTFELGFLNANNIKVKLSGLCKAAEIGGETIDIRYPWINKVFFDIVEILLFKKKKRAHLRCESIEGDRIYIENTTAASVKGNVIEIGPGCNIKNVEYKERLYIDNASVVESSSQG